MLKMLMLLLVLREETWEKKSYGNLFIVERPMLRKRFGGGSGGGDDGER